MGIPAIGYGSVAIYNFMKKILLLVLTILFLPAVVSAHQPRITTEDKTVVVDPEVSKAYYAQLAGEPQVYTINATAPFDMYVNILVPDIAGQKKDVVAVIVKDGVPLATLGGDNVEWKPFWEPFGRDSYWMGPEYKETAVAGEYKIYVSSSDNDSKYSLAIGEKEVFDFKESVNALRLIPQIKRDFFNESPAGFIFSVFGIGYVIIIFVFAFIFGFVYRLLLKRFVKGTLRGLHKNIGKNDRWMRFALGAGLLALAITTSWSPILLFLSGFCFFESIFSWCGLYAAMGKNTCPL